MSFFNKISTQKLTQDQDDGRNNFNTSIVKAPDGKLIAFYEKGLVSGRESNSRVQVDQNFDINVEAGSGTILYTPVTWGATTVTLPASSFSLIYVDVSGQVLVTQNPSSISTTTVSILLAYVRTGSSEVTVLEEIEKTGKYIYVQYQVLSGTEWVWDQKEYILNVGEQPRAFYDRTQDKLLLSYVRDSIGYMRLFDLTDELTFEYLTNYTIENDVINLKTDPSHSIQSMFAALSDSETNLVSTTVEYEFAYYMLGYAISIDETGTFHHYVHMPWMEALNYTSLSISDIYLEIYTKSGTDYVLEQEIPIPLDKNNEIRSREHWVDWTGTFGPKFLKIRFYHGYRTRRIPKDSYHEEYFLEYQDLYYERDGINTTDRLFEYFRLIGFATTPGEAGIAISYEELKDNIYDPMEANFVTVESEATPFLYEESKELLEDSLDVNFVISKPEITLASS